MQDLPEMILTWRSLQELHSSSYPVRAFQGWGDSIRFLGLQSVLRYGFIVKE